MSEANVKSQDVVYAWRNGTNVQVSFMNPAHSAYDLALGTDPNGFQIAPKVDSNAYGVTNDFITMIDIISTKQITCGPWSIADVYDSECGRMNSISILVELAQRFKVLELLCLNGDLPLPRARGLCRHDIAEVIDDQDSAIAERIRSPLYLPFDCIIEFVGPG